MSTEVLGPEQLVATMFAYREALATDQAIINRLNVFPVPDGDTGTNMLLTLESVAAALASATPADGSSGLDMAGVAAVVGRSALMGARGICGVILCQVLRGMCGDLAPLAKAGATEVSHALQAASDAASAAVLQPAKGTILTVAAAAAAAAVAESARPSSLVRTVEAARRAAIDALWHTPDQLPVLAAAGVVDAGGAGLTLIFDAMLRVLDDRPLPGLELPEGVRAVACQSRADAYANGGHRTAGTGAVPFAGTGALPFAGAGGDAGALPFAGTGALPFAGTGGEADADAGAGAGGEAGGEADTDADLRAVPFVGCRYEVMYLLEAADEAIPAFKEVWAGLGDSIVVVGGEGLWSCHIHTDEIGASIEAALDAGRPRQIRVTDLAEQVEEESWVREEAARAAAGSASDGDVAGLESLGPRRSHVVAVAVGDGIRRIFRSLGVEGVVAGGQSMNPSTAEVLEVIEKTPGAEVVVLPNNPNIVPVAEQAAALSTKHVVVVRTRAIQEGFAALLEYDPEAGADENAARMGEAARRVLTGEVTRAVRATESPAGPVARGDFIGLARSGIVAVSSDLAEATCALLDSLLAPGHELVTLFEGAGASAAATRHVSEWLTATHPGVELERHIGGQPLYPYLVTVE